MNQTNNRLRPSTMQHHRAPRDRVLACCLALVALLCFAILVVARRLDAPAVALLSLKLAVLTGSVGAIGTLVLSFSLGRRRAEKLALRLLTTGITLAVSIILAEFGIRFALRGITTTADNTSYFADRWNQENVRLNSYGFRDREVPASKPAGTLRIVVLGDSFAFGQGLAEDQRFSNLLGDALRPDASEVYNFAWPGAETVDQLATLQNVVLDLEPDFILVQWFVNDVEGHDKSLRPSSRPLWSHWVRPILHQNSALYFLANNQIKQTLNRLNPKPSYEDYMRHRFADPASLDSATYQQVLLDLFRAAKTANVPVGMVLFPRLRPDLASGYPFEFLHQRVLELCDAEQVPCLDLLPVFAELSDDVDSLQLNRFDGHPSALAHQVATREILGRFRPWLRARAQQPN